MEQARRLSCPECGLVYRLRRTVPGKTYSCPECGSGLNPTGEGENPPGAAPAAGRREGDQRRFRECCERLEDGIKSLDSGLDIRLAALEEMLSGIMNRLSSLDPARLEERIDASERRLAADIAAGGKSGEPAAAGPASEKYLDDLASRLVEKIGPVSRIADPENGSIVDALVRMADELAKEQAANTSRLEQLAGEIHGAAANIANLEEWRGGLPDKVADEIGQTVEKRVVGPVAGALARQAPAILSDLQDNRLVDIVSRSVREAQRPLLREILSGGRMGVPIWLFAATLLPLLLLLGYQFLPGGAGPGAGPGGLRDGGGLAELAAKGVPLTREADDRLRNIEEAVIDIHDQALAHARNSAALEEEVKNLDARLREKEALVSEYQETLQRQVRLINVYRTRLAQLGVPLPDPPAE
ncbi:MAG: hypothetical protein LBU64_04365 [Planctomycetota bacterium]|nr:hypothetical protein [Planctomycetota bacterium]